MLIQFSVENFRSFKEKAVLSLEASQDTEKEDHVVVAGKDRILKNIVIFGANAAGKSNIFRALTAAILTVRFSNRRQVTEPMRAIVPFAFSDEMCWRPSTFEFVFLADGEKYVYRFSATQEKIVSENLYVYHTAKPSVIFERTGETYRFTNPAIQKELLPIVQRNTPNKLFLATATAWNAHSTQVPFLWFEKIDTYTNNYEDLKAKDFPLLENDTDRKLSHFICDLLQKADINISDYEFQAKDISEETWMSGFPPAVRAMIPDEVAAGKHKSYEIYMTHRTDTEEGQEEWRLSIQDESQGTRNLFMLSPVLYEAFSAGKILCIDEFDASLHPLLVNYLISLFHDPDINTAHAQLIISSHTMAILSRRVSRDDEIYFVEKNRDTGESELYSLDEFSPRKQMNIRKAYLLGRFGAVPDIEGGDLLW